MRLKRSRLKRYYLTKALLKKDGEGNSYIEYDTPEAFQAEECPAGGKVQTELYGVRLPNIRNLRFPGTYQESTSEISGKTSYILKNGMELTVSDGICLFTDPERGPDYKIIAIYPYRFLTIEVERM